MIQYNPKLLNERIAPEIAEFFEADIPDLRQEFDQATYWLSNHFLDSMFRPVTSSNWKQWEINLLFRAQAQFEAFHLARDLTSQFFAQSSLHNPVISVYFKALSQWELAFLNFQIFIDIYQEATKKRAFSHCDGTAEQKAYVMANTIKHWANDIKNNRHQPSQTIPLWLSKDGFHTLLDHLLYSELADLTREVANTAECIMEPPSK